MPIVTMSDYQDNTGLPSQGAAGSFRDRTCPNLVTWWNFSWDAYRLEPSLDRPMFIRRLCMWIVLLLRVLMGLIAFERYANSLRIEMMVLSPILTMVEFFFIGFCLAHIGQSEGKRRVLAVMVVSTDSMREGSYFGRLRNAKRREHRVDGTLTCSWYSAPSITSCWWRSTTSGRALCFGRPRAPCGGS